VETSERFVGLEFLVFISCVSCGRIIVYSTDRVSSYNDKKGKVFHVLLRNVFLKIILLLLVFLFPAQHTLAGELPANIQILLAPQYQSIPKATAFLHALRQELIESSDLKDFGSYEVKVVIGAKTLDGILNSINEAEVIIAAQINSLDFFERYGNKSSLLSAVYNDVDPAVQYDLARKLIPKGLIVAAATERTNHLRPSIPAHWITLGPGEGVDDLLRSMPMNASGFLLLNDSSFVHSGNIRLLRDGLYKRNIPIIGFSEKLIALGSVLVVYPTAEAQIAELVRRIHSGSHGKVVESAYVQDVNFLINDKAANAHYLSLEMFSAEAGE